MNNIRATEKSMFVRILEKLCSNGEKKTVNKDEDKQENAILMKAYMMLRITHHEICKANGKP